jgi:hypothetical protein
VRAVFFLKHNSNTKVLLSKLMELPCGEQYEVQIPISCVQMSLAGEFQDLLAARFAFIGCLAVQRYECCNTQGSTLADHKKTLY